MRDALKFYHGSLGVPRGIGDDLDVACADPELGQELLHLLLLHPCLIMLIMIILIMIFFCDSILTSMVLLNISNMLMFLLSLSLPVVNTLRVQSENCCLMIMIMMTTIIIIVIQITKPALKDVRQHWRHPAIVVKPPDVDVPSTFLVLELPEIPHRDCVHWQPCLYLISASTSTG